jgi:nucleoside diphosphate kinase
MQTLITKDMTKSGLPKSARKFIRLEKARIRTQFFDIKKQEEMIGELYKRMTSKPVVDGRPEEGARSNIKKSKTKVQKSKTQVKVKKEKKAK